MYLSHSTGRLWFEVEVLEGRPYSIASLVVGFAGTNFQGVWLGKDERGWGIDTSGAALHRQVEGPGPERVGALHFGGSAISRDIRVWGTRYGAMICPCMLQERGAGEDFYRGLVGRGQDAGGGAGP